jgi:Golgi nucleoside diphosphatase
VNLAANLAAREKIVEMLWKIANCHSPFTAAAKVLETVRARTTGKRT